MTASLPDSIVASIPPWRGATLLSATEIGHGSSNRSWRVSVDGEDFVLRLASRRVPPPVYDPQRELAIHRAAAAVGLAPEVVHADPGAGVLVTRYIAGDLLSSADIAMPEALAEIGNLLSRVRMLPDPGGHYGLATAGERYLDAITDEALARQGVRLVEMLRQLPEPREFGVCHMDPVAGNLLRTAGGLLLLDWEFAVAGDPLFDLGAVVSYHDLDAAAADILLASWAEDRAESLRGRLAALVRAHDALHWLWLVARGEHASPARARLDQRLDIVPPGKS